MRRYAVCSIVREIARTTASAVLILILGASGLVIATAGPASAAATTVEQSFAGKLNHARALRGVPRLAMRSDLVAVARGQARRMAARNTLYHNPQLASQVKNWRWVGENVGYGPDARAVHVAFMNSPGHRANILDRDYTEMGIGAVVVNGRVWVAEVFRRPLHKRATSAAYKPLHRGSTGPAVKRVQRRLDIPATGFYGRLTANAVERVQRRHGWAGSGSVGPKTWRLLFG